MIRYERTIYTTTDGEFTKKEVGDRILKRETRAVERYEGGVKIRHIYTYCILSKRDGIQQKLF